MGFFDSLKQKIKIGKQIVDSIDEYKKTLDKGKYLKKADLLNIPDSELETVVMNWMWNKFNKDWSNQYEVVVSLSKHCQNVYSCRTVIDEINNGGLNQLFFNSTGQFADMSIGGFAAMDSIKLSDIMYRAVELYKQNKEILNKYNDGTLKSFSASYEEGIFEELDKEFYNECDNFSSIEYIKKHAIHFGD